MLREIPFIYSVKVRWFTLAVTLMGPGGLLMPIKALADAITDAAQQGQIDAAEFLNNAPTGNFSGGNAGYNDPITGSPVALDPNDFYQADSATTEQTDQFSEITTTYGNEGNLITTVGAYSGGGSSAQDEAFDIVKLGQTRSHPDMSADPIWDTTDATMGDFDTIASTFADCSTVTSIGSTTKVNHIADFKRCERTYVPKSSCTINHPYDAVLMELSNSATSAGAFASCGPGCYDLWVGKVGDNYWGGWCTVYEQDTAVRIFYPDAIISAIIVQAQWDDYLQIFISGNKLYNGPNANFPPELYGGVDYTLAGADPFPGFGCELGTSWNVNPNIDVTSYFKSTAPGDILDFKTRVSVAGNGEGYSKIRIYYDISKIITNDIWEPIQCADDYNIAKDSVFCTGASAVCTIQLATSTYTNPDGVTFDNSSLGPSPIATISNLCKQVKVTTQCDFATGTLDCYTDVNGNVQCPTSTSASANGCSAYEVDPNCAFVSSGCVGGAFDVATGKCMVTEDTYDCGYDVSITTDTIDEDFQCPGPVRCMGSECILDTQESNNSFTQFAATMEAVKMMSMDMECDITAGGGGGPGTDCKIFGGEGNWCKKAIGGTVDCCEQPTGVSLADYLVLIYAIYTLDQAVKEIENPGDIAGAWLTMSDAVTETYDMISVGVESMWTSAKESIFGGGVAGADAAAASGSAVAEEGMISGFKQQMIDQTQQWMVDTFSEETAALLFEENAATGAMELGGPVGTIGAGIMTAYMYYQLAVIAINIIYACEDHEFELNAKRALKSAHFIGSYCAQKVIGQCLEKRESYCTFASPLSRIMNEQLRPIIGVDWGTPEAPQCDGLSLNQMNTVDWSGVDLSEWEALLVEYNIIPTSADITMENITGSGNVLDINGDRDNVLERTQDRINADDPEQIRQNIREDAWN